MSEKSSSEKSKSIRRRVMNARAVQSQRFMEHRGIHYNAQMSVKLLGTYCSLDDGSLKLLENAMDKLRLSARAYDRILKVSRTIADLEGSEHIKPSHIAEAIQYRSLDRDLWASS